MANEVNIDASELGDAARDVAKLNKNVQIKVRKFAAMAAQNLINRIERNIDRIFDGHGQRKDRQVRLKDSFNLKQGTNKHTIRSNAPHALPLEESADPHDIEAGGGAKNADALTLPTRTAPSSAISESEEGQLYVLRNKVEHPGNRAYGYIYTSQKRWEKQYLEPRLPREMRRAITKSGFKPEGI